ncbi:MAG TPA: lysylphosphatidylglycerol synthase transmembrane domain-containing protein [Burkholderiales bacterium]|nr:lysylphosphatidylglycerol synthase transmembrane domain-containing protein [Burkholderiales bacterium]
MKPAILLLLRAAVSISILAVILSRVSIDAVLLRAKGGALAYLAAALLLVLVMALLVALRWRFLAAWLGLAVPGRLAVRAVFLGLFGGQLLPSVIGTDLLRGFVLARHTGRLQRVAASLIADRLVALFAACLLLILGYASLGRLPAPFAGLLVPAAALLSGAALLAFLLGSTGVVRRVFRVQPVEGVTLQPKPILAAIVVAFAIHSIAVVAAALTAAAYGIDASLKIWLPIVPLAVIASAVPISINGWGVRETVIVALGAGYGLVAADALLVSLTLGALNLVASLPGAYLLLRAPRD